MVRHSSSSLSSGSCAGLAARNRMVEGRITTHALLRVLLRSKAPSPLSPANHPAIAEPFAQGIDNTGSLIEVQKTCDAEPTLDLAAASCAVFFLKAREWLNVRPEGSSALAQTWPWSDARSKFSRSRECEIAAVRARAVEARGRWRRYGRDGGV